jgi:hypothetical protein
MAKLKFKTFQIEDLARAACRDALILSWDKGGGKTFAAFAWPLIKEAKRTLIVGLEDLHPQFQDTARHFGHIPIPLKSIDDLKAWKLHKPRNSDKPQFFICTFQQLGQNGADEATGEEKRDGEVVYPETIIKRRRKELKALKSKTTFLEASENVGEVRDGIVCVWKPSLATMLAVHDSFDCVVVDEAVRLQGTDSYVSRGIRRLNPQFRMCLTGTPIKNRLESFFWLGWWTAKSPKEANDLWPYDPTSESRERFANDHSQEDRFLTREDAYYEINKKSRKMVKRSARICNIHRLWKLISPLVLRRRKCDFGEDIVAKTFHSVVVPFGAHQKDTYQYWVKNLPTHTRAGKYIEHGRAKVAMQINLLRQAALCPSSPKLAPVDSDHSMTPKMAAILGLIADRLMLGEQVMVGSSYHDFSTYLEGYLKQAGVSFVRLDGLTSPKKRGGLAQKFKNREYSVMIAGQQAMSEGHSFECCNNLIVPSVDWAFDVNDQIIDRVHRLTSLVDVNIWVIETEDSIDQPIAKLFKDKSDSSSLAFDGMLTEEVVQEVDAMQLATIACETFNSSAETLCETDLYADWVSTLKTKLRAAQLGYCV